jgi:DNA-binding SARP family transcriptional activator
VPAPDQVVAVRLFGPGRLSRGDDGLRPHSAKALALLALLVLEGDRPQSRTRLAGMLWPDASEAAARHGLRQALHSLRTLGGGALQGCIEVDADTVRFVPRPEVDVDVLRLLACAESGDIGGASEVAALYRAPLLDGRRIEAGEAWSTWLDAARARLHALAVRSLERSIVEHLGRGERSAALAQARVLRALEPTGERAARRLARLLDDAAPDDAHDDAAPQEAPHAAWQDALDGGRPRGRSAGDANDEAEAFVRAARAAEAVYAFGSAAELHGRALALLRPSDDATRRRRCEVLLQADAVLERLGRRGDRIRPLDEAIAIAGSAGDRALLAMALIRQAGARAYAGDADGAERSGLSALAACREIGDRPGEAEALRELGFVHWRTGDPTAALRYAREALELHRRLGDGIGEASALHNLAEIHLGLGSARRAIEFYQRALELHWSSRNAVGEILTLFGLADALQQASDAAGARRRLEAALALCERHGERTMASRALHALAVDHHARGEPDEALALMRRAVAVDRAIGYAEALGHDLVDLALLHAARGERTQATATLQEARIWFVATDDGDAVAAADALLEGVRAGSPPEPFPAASRSRVRTHLPRAEGKVYCHFESPLRPAA